MVWGIVGLSACGKMSQLDASVTGYSKICVGGVVYLQFPSGAATHVDKEGKPVSCPE